jgi:hypothetical protein
MNYRVRTMTASEGKNQINSVCSPKRNGITNKLTYNDLLNAEICVSTENPKKNKKIGKVYNLKDNVKMLVLSIVPAPPKSENPPTYAIEP